jgi:hypothetical protein
MAVHEARQTQSYELAWAGLLAAVRRDYLAGVERTVDHMRSMPSYANLDGETLGVVVRGNFESVLAGLESRQPPRAPADVRAFDEPGAVRARQGVALSDMLAAWRVGLDSLYLLARQVAPPGPERDGLLLEFLELTVAWVDFAMLAAAEGHRRVEVSQVRSQQHTQASLIRRLRSGAAPAAETRLTVAALGLDPEASFYALRARPDPGSDLETIERYLGADLPAARAGGVMTIIDGDVCGFVSSVPRGPAPAAIGVSEPARLHEMQPAFRQADRALDTALALGAKGVFDLMSLGVQAAVVGDPDLGDAMVRRYIAPMLATPNGEVVLHTVQRFLINDRNFDATARDLDVHMNTVRHRLGRFEDATGRSLRDTETSFEVWWALERRRLA